jgi:hypothetical protein
MFAVAVPSTMRYCAACQKHSPAFNFERRLSYSLSLQGLPSETRAV